MRELTNIGAGHAANAFSPLVGRTVSDARADDPAAPGRGGWQHLPPPRDDERGWPASLLRSRGGVEAASLALLFPRTGGDPRASCSAGDAHSLAARVESALREVGNILASHVASAHGRHPRRSHAALDSRLAMRTRSAELAALVALRGGRRPRSGSSPRSPTPRAVRGRPRVRARRRRRSSRSGSAAGAPSRAPAHALSARDPIPPPWIATRCGALLEGVKRGRARPSGLDALAQAAVRRDRSRAHRHPPRASPGNSRGRVRPGQDGPSRSSRASAALRGAGQPVLVTRVDAETGAGAFCGHCPEASYDAVARLALVRAGRGADPGQGDDRSSCRAGTRRPAGGARGLRGRAALRQRGRADRRRRRRRHPPPARLARPAACGPRPDRRRGHGRRAAVGGRWARRPARDRGADAASATARRSAGVAALLGMLTSCASNVTVVNIDNGFGAAYVATLINRL